MLPEPPDVDPDEVRAKIAELAVLSDDIFAKAVAAAIKPSEPEPVLLAAIRSEDLAVRSHIATQYLIDQVNIDIDYRTKSKTITPEWRRAAETWRQRVARERRTLGEIVADVRASKGIAPGGPNPRGEAYRLLAQRHPVEYLEVLREVQAARAGRQAKLKRDQRSAAGRTKKRRRGGAR